MREFTEQHHFRTSEPGRHAQEAEAHAQLDEAGLALGANFIDTAELYPVAFNYGKTTEKWIGTWLAARTATKQLARSDVIIATKGNPNMIGGNPEGEKARPHGYEADIVERSCRQSIERMPCEYIDLYQHIRSGLNLVGRLGPWLAKPI